MESLKISKLKRLKFDKLKITRIKTLLEKKTNLEFIVFRRLPTTTTMLLIKTQ